MERGTACTAAVPSDADTTMSGMQRPSDKSDAKALPSGVETRSVDGRAPVGSSSTRPSPTSETHHDAELDALALESVLDELTETAGELLDDAGFCCCFTVSLEVEYQP